MTRFKVGDVITPIEGYSGFEEARILRIDDKNYYLKIVNGTATMSIKAESCYKLLKDKPKYV